MAEKSILSSSDTAPVQVQMLILTHSIYQNNIQFLWISNREIRNKVRESCSVLWHVRVGCVIPFWQFNLLSGEIELSRVDLFLDRLEANKSFFKTELYGLYTSLDRTNSIFSYLNGNGGLLNDSVNALKSKSLYL